VKYQVPSQFLRRSSISCRQSVPTSALVADRSVAFHCVPICAIVFHVASFASTRVVTGCGYPVAAAYGLLRGVLSFPVGQKADENDAYYHRLYYHRLYVKGSLRGVPVTVPDWALRVRALRKSLDLKQVEFAVRFSVTQAAVSRWESGTKEPSPENYIRMANMAAKPACLWFLEKAGVDVPRLRTLILNEKEGR
jgi:hypothetical protein